MKERISAPDTPECNRWRYPVAAIALLGASALGGCAADSTPAPTVNEAAQSRSDSGAYSADMFDDMTIVSLDNPRDYIMPALTDHYLESSFTQALSGISQTLDGKIDVPETIPVIHMVAETVTRHDKNGEEYQCFDREDIAQARTEALNNARRSTEARAPIVVQAKEKICGEAESAAVAFVGGGVAGESGVYHIDTFDNDIDEVVRIIQHETGHTEGFNLGHIGSFTRDGSDKLLRNDSDGSKDIVDLVRSGAYKLVGRADEHGEVKLNQYSGRGSVMGFSKRDAQRGDVYNFVEQHQIDPTISPIQKIDYSNHQEYQLSTLDKHDRGISFDLPSDHPLYNLPPDAKVTSLAFGLNTPTDDYSAELMIYGRQDNGHLISIETISYLPYLDHDKGDNGQVEVYRDSHLGISITASTDLSLMTENNASVTLRVNPLPES